MLSKAKLKKKTLHVCFYFLGMWHSVLRSQVVFTKHSILYLRMLLLFVVLKLWPGHRLLTHITQCNVSPTVDLMGGEIRLWDFVFTDKRNTLTLKKKSLIPYGFDNSNEWPYMNTYQLPQNCVFSSAMVTKWPVDRWKTWRKKIIIPCGFCLNNR